MEDTRFSPMKMEEVPQLDVAVSFLINFDEGNDIYDFEIGKHGIWIHFEHGGIF